MGIDLQSLAIGALIGLAGALGTSIFSKLGEDIYQWTKRKLGVKSSEGQPQLIVHFEKGEPKQLSAQHESPLASAKAVRLSSVTLEQIASAIDQAPPMQRGRVAEGFRGIRIEWDTQFVNGYLSEDEKTIRLRLKPKESLFPRISCQVPAHEYRELGVTREGAPVRVTGTVLKVDGYDIELGEVTLTFDS